MAVIMGCRKAGASRIIGIDINPDKFKQGNTVGAHNQNLYTFMLYDSYKCQTTLVRKYGYCVTKLYFVSF